MCGFAGFISPDHVQEAADHICQTMGDAIAHRGPDGSGVWVNDPKTIGLVHRRLSIQDLSEHGAQPMARGALTLVFNGEIYNHFDLRRDLDQAGCSITWQGHSDTETLLQGFAHWGVADTLQRATGMFAFALWDETRGSLTLGRDRFGEKPLYYGYQNNTLLFGSDLGSLRQHPDFAAQINADVLPLYLRFHYIPTPYSIYKGIHKLDMGHTLMFTRADLAAKDMPASVPYWSFTDMVHRAKNNMFEGSYDDAKEAVRKAILGSVQRQSISDVPLGAFLSGGIDSSTIVSVMQSQLTQKVATFTIGSDDSAYDESGIAAAIAGHLGTDHTQLIATADDVINCVPKMPGLYTEPFADVSQLPTFMVSQLAQQHVTVALSGDGGDEVFGGYNRYLGGVKAWQTTRKVPAPLRRVAAKGLRCLSAQKWDALFQKLKPALPKSLAMRTPGSNILKLSYAMSQETDYAYYLSAASRWQHPEQILQTSSGALPIPRAATWDMADDLNLSFAERMMAADTLGFMSDDVLVKVDRAAMGCSLETRVPFLDHTLVELAWRLPLEMKIQNGTGKRILRDIVADHIPADILNQPKTGFGIPVGTWLRGPLRDWAENLLDRQTLHYDGFFDADQVRKIWADHLSGVQDGLHLIWPILMFQAWKLDAQLPQRTK